MPYTRETLPKEGRLTPESAALLRFGDQVFYDPTSKFLGLKLPSGLPQEAERLRPRTEGRWYTLVEAHRPLNSEKPIHGVYLDENDGIVFAVDEESAVWGTPFALYGHRWFSKYRLGE